MASTLQVGQSDLRYAYRKYHRGRVVTEPNNIQEPRQYIAVRSRFSAIRKLARLVNHFGMTRHPQPLPRNLSRRKLVTEVRPFETSETLQLQLQD